MGKYIWTRMDNEEWTFNLLIFNIKNITNNNNLFVKITGIAITVAVLISLIFSVIKNPEILRDKSIQTQVIESITELNNEIKGLMNEMNPKELTPSEWLQYLEVSDLVSGTNNQ